MIKLLFHTRSSAPKSELSPYSSITRIPFSLKLTSNHSLNVSSAINKRERSDQSFLEFRFDSNTKELYEISLLNIQIDLVRLQEKTPSWQLQYYDCRLCDIHNGNEILKRIFIERSESSLNLIWEESAPLTYYSIAQNCAVGTNDENELCAVLLYDLSKAMIYEILGF